MTFDNDNNTAPGALSPDDPRISAYAFGELEGAELAAVEAAVAADAALAARVAELIEFGGELGGALDAEETPTGGVTTEFAPAERRRTARFAGWMFATGGLLAAACLALVLWLRDGSPTTPSDERRSADVVLPPEAPDDPAPASVHSREAGLAEAPVPEPESPKPDPMSAPVSDESADAMIAAHEIEPRPDAGGEGLAMTPPDDKARSEAPAGPTGGTALPELKTPEARNIAPPLLATLDGGGPATVRTMLNQGRGQYAAGNLDAAAAIFDQVKKRDSGNREATYFTSRIARDRARTHVSAATGDGVSVALSRPRVAVVSTLPAAPNSKTGAQQDRRIVAPEHEPIAFVSARARPRSTFSIDVDTGSYPLIRREILEPRRTRPASGDLPAMPIEELINYFPYGYAPPQPDAQGNVEPFAVHLAAVSAPWNPDHRLVRVAIKGRAMPPDIRPPANLVFVVDVSASMMRARRLVRKSLVELLDRLRPDDRVAIVTFGKDAQLDLPSTPVSQREQILAAIMSLRQGGFTNGGEGIALAYEVARNNFQAEGVNRVIFCSDGMFNVGVMERAALLALIRENALGRVYLTVLGYGGAPLWVMRWQDGRVPSGLEALQLLANNGNGVFGFVDTSREALKLLGDEVDGTLAAIAKDVKLKVSFDPSVVESYRLIGYEDRALSEGEFAEAATDGGEIGAGHTATALYEVVPVSKQKLRRAALAVERGEKAPEMLTLEIRYKLPESDEEKTMSAGLADVGADFDDADADFKFASAVAAWGMLLREGERSRLCAIDDVLDWAKEGMGDDADGYRAEFMEVAERSEKLFRAARQRSYP